MSRKTPRCVPRCRRVDTITKLDFILSFWFLFVHVPPGSAGDGVGQLHILREDYDGNRSLLTVVMPGEIFAEALCCVGVAESPVTVMAHTEATVLLLPYQRIPHACPNACAHHAKLIENLLRLTAQKNLLLQSRMEIVCLKSVRAKVLRYLASFAPEQGRQITVPFSREEMADYLCVERSALSHELARMKRDGLIEYRKNSFVLKKH